MWRNAAKDSDQKQLSAIVVNKQGIMPEAVLLNDKATRETISLACPGPGMQGI